MRDEHLPSQETFRKMYDYCPVRGCLLSDGRSLLERCSDPQPDLPKEPVGLSGYITLVLKSTLTSSKATFKTADLIWFWHHGAPRGRVVHINGNPKDTHIENLQIQPSTKQFKNRFDEPYRYKEEFNQRFLPKERRDELKRSIVHNLAVGDTQLVDGIFGTDMELQNPSPPTSIKHKVRRTKPVVLTSLRPTFVILQDRKFITHETITANFIFDEGENMQPLRKVTNGYIELNTTIKERGGLLRKMRYTDLVPTTAPQEGAVDSKGRRIFQVDEQKRIAFIRAGVVRYHDHYGQVMVSDGKRYITESHLVWFYFKKKWPRAALRHKDGDLFNNHIDNLRCV